MPRLLRQAEILIDAIHTYRGIPDPHPDVRSLTDLIDCFDTFEGAEGVLTKEFVKMLARHYGASK